MTTSERTVGRYLRWLLATLSLGAGVIHFAASGDHYELSWLHGTFFAVVAWLQLAWAVGVIVRPTRAMLAAGVVLNAAVVATWTLSRTWGIPIGPDAWHAEPVALADALASGFEIAIVVVSLVVLLRPAVASQRMRPALGVGSFGFVIVGVAVVSSMAVAPAFASSHDHRDGDAHANGDEAATADHSHVAGHTETVISADGSSACEQAGVANEGNSGHGHRGPVPFTPMDAATRDTLADEITQANEFVAAHPTVADAEADGYVRITPYVPCIAADYIDYSALVGSGFDPARPEIVLFAGTDPDSEIVGLSYLQFNPGPPPGFAGDNDPWHIHARLCLGRGGVLGDESTTPEECAARGGRLADLGNLWMMHMWNVPGWESRWGLFSSEHPDLGGVIGNIDAPAQEVAAARAQALADKAAKSG